MGHAAGDHVDSKKRIRPTVREETGATFMLRCCKLNLVSDEVLDAYDMGMVYDMLIEMGNDQETYNIKATQTDIDEFWG